MGSCRWRGSRDVSTVWEQAEVKIWDFIWPHFRQPDTKLFKETGTSTTGVIGVVSGSVPI